MNTLPIETKMAVVRQTVEALRALGDTAVEVAGSLRAGGHKGQLEDRRSCPVAVYLLANPLPALEGFTADLEVNGLEAIRCVHLEGAAYDVVTVNLPSPVAEFVRCFDRRYDFCSDLVADALFPSPTASLPNVP